METFNLICYRGTKKPKIHMGVVIKKRHKNATLYHCKSCGKEMWVGTNGNVTAIKTSDFNSDFYQGYKTCKNKQI